MVHDQVEPHASGMLPVGDGNAIHWECAGNPDGVPAVLLHGGPGSGSSQSMLRLFDPRAYRTVSFDQRGCGQSLPGAADLSTDMSVNTTAHLVADIERLRQHLGVERWVVFGNSWGATLALAYCQRHRNRVPALILQAVTTSSLWEIDRLFTGLGQVFVEQWAALQAAVQADGDGVLAAYDRALGDPDPVVRQRAADAWHAWELCSIFGDPAATMPPRWLDPRYRLTRARICAHYFANGCFLEDGVLLRNAHLLAGLPGIMVHGRADIGSPLEVAKALAARWPEGELVIVEEAGHSAGDPGMAGALLAATARFAKQLG